MTGVEFDEIFKDKIQEVCTKITKAAHDRGFVMMGNIQIIKFRDFIYGFKFAYDHPNSRGFYQVVYTVMYNNKTNEYTYHEGYPNNPSHADGRIVN